ncbi:MAG: hypothetical protein ACYTGC_07270 [Planctomycetota bacterium]|jgi:hypothetical protein
MKEFRLRRDLDRAVVDGFAMALGFAPGRFAAPRAGYTVTYNDGEGDDPDTYTFQVAVSHERLGHLCRSMFGLLPDQVFAILEIGSRDAYRSVDVYLGAEPIDRGQFKEVWNYFESFLLEDSSVAAGANAEEPFVEIFVDQRKCLLIHVPLAMRDDVEAILHEAELEEVPDPWPEWEDIGHGGPELRPVLDVADVYSPDVDELLLQLRHGWQLHLNVNPDTNVDEAGRELGMTLWRVVVIVLGSRDDGEGAYASVWLTAKSLADAEQMVQDAIDDHPDWEFGEIYTVDRVAYDERPDELGDLPPRPTEAGVQLVNIEPWTEPESGSSAGSSDG